MISPEIIRRYPFFAGLTQEQVTTLANSANQQKVDQGRFIFHEGEDIDQIYLIIEGAVVILLEPPDQQSEQSVGAHLMGDFETREAVVSTVGTGDIVGWSALMNPPLATAAAKALTACRIVGMDRAALMESFRLDPAFGYLMLQKVAEVIRDRLRDQRVESLAYTTG